jgi:hypothetical protein
VPRNHPHRRQPGSSDALGTCRLERAPPAGVTCDRLRDRSILPAAVTLSKETLVARCIVTVEGVVRNCKAVKGLPFMNSPVLEALQRREYRPATLQGKPLDVYYTFNIHLRLPQ